VNAVNVVNVVNAVTVVNTVTVVNAVTVVTLVTVVNAVTRAQHPVPSYFASFAFLCVLCVNALFAGHRPADYTQS
jgi:hypothetical protein